MPQILHLGKIIITNTDNPILNGGLLTENGRIIAVGAKEDFGKDIETIDHGEALICPGFINLHSHLTYTDAKEINGNDGLFPWIESLLDKTSEWNELTYRESAKSGINEILSSGTILIVENSPTEITTDELSKSLIKSLIGLEIFGSDEDSAEEIFSQSKTALSKLEEKYKSNKNLSFTFSPHATYDVSLPLWKKIIDWSKKEGKLILTHIDESSEEIKWWQEKSGSGINLWKKINKLNSKLKHWKKYSSGVDFLNRNSLLDKNIVSTHLCEVNEEHLTLIKEFNISAIHCPRSNSYLNCKTVDLKLWDKLGILWGLGTDSKASNDSLDLLEELRFALNKQKSTYNYSISSKNAFKKITSDAAQILRLEKNLGCLDKGFSSDFLIYDINRKPKSLLNDPYNWLVWESNNKYDLKEVWINGEKIWLNKNLLVRK